MKTEKFNMFIPAWLKAELKESSKQKGVSMAEYVKDILKHDVMTNRALKHKEKSDLVSDEEC